MRRFVRPPIKVVPPPPGVRFLRDVPIPLRDGTVLRANVFRSATAGRYPVLVCAHPYGKDNLPRRHRFGYRLSMQYRFVRMGAPFQISAWTSWEAPDPAFWVSRSYVVVNVDLRGFGRSQGEGSLLSDAEARDYYEIIEWAAAQPWSSGRIGLNGVSYLALSQWKVAALRPPHLAAICPWEGFSDLYRDFARPGGVREDGFFRLWTALLRRSGRLRDDPRKEQLARPLWDDWWAAHTPALERIEVPALICGSFSDHCLHSRGAFAAFQRIASAQRWLYTHRGGKWATYYSPEALAFQLRFFDHFLKGAANGMPEVPPVRLEVRETGSVVRAVRQEPAWPLPTTRWTPLHLHPDGTLREHPAPAAGAVRFAARGGSAAFDWTVPNDLELTGPMALRLWVECRGAADANLFVGVRKLRGAREVGFEGSYGFNRDLVTRGWLKLSHRQLDAERSTAWQPVHTHTLAQPLQPGELVPIEVELLPSATLFRRGETLRLELRGEPFFPWNPLVGQFPARYERSPRSTIVLHCGGRFDARLLVPLIPPESRGGGT
jgi:predicted acyl esterase